MKRRFLAFILILFLLPCMLSAGRGQSLAVVLSGGGARGLAHIAVLEELERRGIEPDYIVGTSMGALVGAFYAAGYSPSEIRALVEETDLMDIFLHMHSKSTGSSLRVDDIAYLANVATLDFSEDSIGSSNGVIDDQYVAAFLRENLVKVLDVHDFDELQTPFRCIGTDLVTGDEIVFEDGYLFNAIRGSMSLPVIFRPARTDDGRFVIDGGMLNNLPCDVARDLGADYVLAVDVNNALGRQDVLSEDVLETLTGASFQFLDLITQVNSADNYPNADWVLVPELDEFATIDFGAKDAILEKGVKCVEDNQAVFDELSELLEGRENPERHPYSELPDPVFKGFVYPGLERYRYYFNYFTGKTATREVVTEFEETLSYIKKRENLKNIYYDMHDGMVYVINEQYEKLPASISLGVLGDAGFFFNTLGKNADFSFDPKFSTFFTFKFDDFQTLVLGAAEDEYFRLYAAYHNQVLRTLGLFADGSLGFGELSMLSKSDRIGGMNTNDFQLRARAGLEWEMAKNMKLSFAFTIDYDYLERIENPKDLYAPALWEEVNYFGPRFTLKYNWKEYLGLSLYDTGVETDFQFDIFARAPLTYRLSLGVESVIWSPVPHARFLLSFNAESSRTSGDAAYLSEMYSTNYTGLLTRDLVCLDFGGRMIFGHFFFDVSFFIEGLEENPEDLHQLDWILDDEISNIPFSGIDDCLCGGSFSIGFNMESGNLMANFRINHRGQMYLGLVLK